MEEINDFDFNNHIGPVLLVGRQGTAKIRKMKNIISSFNNNILTVPKRKNDFYYGDDGEYHEINDYELYKNINPNIICDIPKEKDLEKLFEKRKNVKYNSIIVVDDNE